MLQTLLSCSWRDRLSAYHELPGTDALVARLAELLVPELIDLGLGGGSGVLVEGRRRLVGQPQWRRAVDLSHGDVVEAAGAVGVVVGFGATELEDQLVRLRTELDDRGGAGQVAAKRLPGLSLVFGIWRKKKQLTSGWI